MCSQQSIRGCIITGFITSVNPASTNIELVLQISGVNDGNTTVNQVEGTVTSPNNQQGRSISSQVSAVNAIAKNECGAVRDKHVLQTTAAITTFIWVQRVLMCKKGCTAVVFRLGGVSLRLFPW